MKYLLSALLLLALVLPGCTDENDPSTDPFRSYDRQAMLTSTRDQVIVPAFRLFTEQSTAFQDQAALLDNSPSNLIISGIQDQWLSAATAWEQAAVYSFGPAETLNLASGVAYEANPTVIENAVIGTAPITQAFVDGLPASAKGLWALEYLLFDRDGGNAALLPRLTTAPDAARRRALIVALATDLTLRAAAAEAAWTAGAYPAAFVAADGNDVNSSISQLANAIVQHTEVLKNKRLGIPLGDANAGVAQPARAVGYRSRTSGQLLNAGLRGIRAAFQGNATTATTPATGLDNLLDHLGAQGANGQKLSDAIQTQFAAAETLATGDIVSLVDQQRQPVLDLQTATKQLTVLLKVDMVSKLGVLLTFNDNDGD